MEDDVLEYVRPTPLSLKDNQEFDEAWVRDRITEDPSILGLGDLEVKDVERMQPKAGRLDILLRDPDTGKRYEVELMLGQVDASHIIRCIEYWDIERKRFPSYDHCAVLVAEDITTRFLNVIGLFNGSIPIIAIQMNAMQFEDRVFLTFTTVLDEIVPGGEEEGDDEQAPPTDRGYWERRGAVETVALADRFMSLLGQIKPGLEPKYNKYYIGLSDHGRAFNFVCFRAKKKFLRVEVRVSDTKTWRQRLEEAGVPILEGGGAKWVAFRAAEGSIEEYRDLILELFQAAYEDFTS